MGYEEMRELRAWRPMLGVLVSLCLVAGAASLDAASAQAARGHVLQTTFGSLGSGPGQLLEPAGVAVDEASGNVYVVDKGNSRVEWFSATGVYRGQFNGSGKFEVEGKEEEGTAAGFGGRAGEIETGEFAGPEGIAVDNGASSPSHGDVYVLDSGHKVVDKFSATGEYLGQLPGLGGEIEGAITGVGADSAGRVWVATQVGTVFEYSAESELISQVKAVRGGCFNEMGLAVASDASFEDDLYLNSECEGGVVAKFSSGGSLLNATFFPVPGGATGLAAELVSGDVYVDGGATVARVGSAGLVEGLPIESLTLAGGAGSGVGVNSASGEVYVAESVAGDVEIFALEPVGPPTVEKEAVSKVTGDSATLEASINPRGASTTYDFEYGACATPTTCVSSGYSSSVPAPEGSAGGAFEVVTVTPVNVQSLSAGTVYHYRVVAHNGHGTVDGAERTFTTQRAGPFALPDGREWEPVSPADKHGALVESIGDEVTIQASAGGGAIGYAADAPTESAPQGFAGPVQVLSARGVDQWASRDMAVPHETATHSSVGKGAQYRFFSGDLSRVVVQPFGSFVACHSPAGVAQPCLSPEASEQTAFLQTSFLNGNPGEACLPPLMHCYEPLVTGAAGVANVPPGTQFGEESSCAPPVPKAVICGPEFVAATPDLKHVLIHSEVALTSPEGGSLYEWSEGKPASKQLAPVSLLPLSEGGGATTGKLGFNGENARNAVSADGSRVFWSTGTSSKEEGPLYVRDVSRGETGETLRLTAGNGEFQDASSDGSRVFYSEGGSLFECPISEEAGELKCPATELGGGLAGTVLGASQDGSWLYFVASSVLANGAVGGKANLYLRHDGTTSLVAVLSDADFPDWSGADVGNLATLAARVSPNGEWLAFMSQRELTGYDNRDAVSGKPDEEVFLYDGRTGKLVCASCNPSGARPVGEEAAQASPRHGRFVVREAWESTTSWLAAEVPAWTAYRLKAAVYQSRYLSDSGRLFFNAIDPLVAHAVNGAWDVYEFEPPGVGSCSEESAGFSERSGGCIGLISGGSSTRDSAFLDASESGNDVFFLTTAKLVAQDADESRDVYDAHVCTGADPCFPAEALQPPACDTEASCRPAPTPQPEVFGAPPSSSFSGPGNIVPPPPHKTAAQVRAEKLAKALAGCRKKRRGHKRSVCERNARRAYGVAKHASKAGASRHAKKPTTGGRGGK